MKSKRLFLQWSLFVILIAIGGVIGMKLGWSDYVFKGDPTHITMIVLGVFTVMTALCGRLCWQVDQGVEPEAIDRSLATPWFASSACVTMGLLGTVIGYLIMMQAAGDEAEQLVRQIRLGMGTVLINTIVGGICGLLIEVQSHAIGQALKGELAKRKAAADADLKATMDAITAAADKAKTDRGAGKEGGP